ncbi:MAG: PAS domain-containing protein [Arenimonas sp.]|nr:PAS domain-containing protein [Arenimonas sp.]
MSTRRGLSQLLLASHMGLVLLFAVLLLATGIGTIRSAVTAQARTEAERVGTDARRQLQAWNRELSVGADLLAQQPTLRFYLQRRQLTKARTLVRNFHKTSDIEYVRVQLGGKTIAEFGVAPPSFNMGLAFDPRGVAWRVLHREVRSLPQASIVIAEKLGDRLDVRPTTSLINAELLPIPEPATGKEDAWTRVLRQVASTGEPVTVGAIGGVAAARIVRIRDEAGGANALLSATIDQEWVERRIVEWFAAFGLSGLVTVVLALGLAIVLAARISRPFAQLALDAERLGSGDLETPVPAPVTFLVEPVALAASLEQMRRQVGTLTATERNQRDELDAVLDGVDEGIVGVDANQLIHYANRQFLALVGRAREDVLGQPAEAVLLPDEAPDNHATPALPVGVAALERCTAADTMRRLIVRRLAASGDRQVLVVREENATEAARAMRDRILANLSHEFQTPLSAQIASIELLRDHLRSSSDAVAIRLTDAQYRGTMRLSQLVDNLLDSVRIESGEMRLRKQPVDLEAVVADAIELMQPLVDQRDQRVVPALRPGPILTGDSQRLFSVMVNLLANANKFAPDQTTIWVEMEWSQERVTVWVEDEGPGLPPLSESSDLFAPFKRSPHEEPSQRGSGLGLAIVHAVVVAHGGEVKLATPVQGHGARIGIVLPMDAQA